ncbi:hypothetical protein Hanom_Chr04g00294521 [Helianthus anomalus]
MLEIIQPYFHRWTGYLLLISISKHSFDEFERVLTFLNLSTDSLVVSNVFGSFRDQLLNEQTDEGRSHGFSH